MKSKEDNISRLSLLCGVVAPIMLMATIIILGEITPDYNPVSDSISQMGAPGRPYANVLSSGYAVYGVLMGAAAYGLHRGMDYTATAKKLSILLGVHAVSTVLLGVFPDNLNLTPQHLGDNFLHNTISAFSYLPLFISILIVRGIASQEKGLKVAGILGLFVIIVNLPMPAINYVPPLEPFAGLVQRLLSGSISLWVTLAFALLYRKRLILLRQSQHGNLPLTLPHSIGHCQ